MPRFLIIFFLIVFLGAHASVCADSTILAVQRKLKTLGLYRGVIDGIPGSKTNAAVRRYQIKNNLIITGELNEETFRSLKISAFPTEITGSLPSKATLAWIFKSGPLQNATLQTKITTLQHVQRHLQKLGYYKGKTDGAPSRALVEALLRWQQKAGLQKTGRLDKQSLTQLGVFIQLGILTKKYPTFLTTL